MSAPEELSASARSRRSRGRRRAIVALTLALGTHGLVIVLAPILAPLLDSLYGAPRVPVVAASGEGGDQPMELESIVENLDAPDKPTREEKKRADEQKKQEEDKNQKGQVVDIAQPAVEQRPDNAKFLAEYDSKVDHEKKGPSGRDKAGAKAAPPPVPALQPAPALAPAAGGQGGKAGAAGVQVAAATPKRASTGGHDGMPVADDGEMQRQTGNGHGADRPADPRSPLLARPMVSGQAGESGDGKAAGEQSPSSAPRPNLTPTPEMLQRAIGQGSGSMDYLKGLDDGDETALNAKKFKFASFFNRVKRAVQQTWNPTAVYVQHDPSGNVYGVKDRVTVLRVNLQPDGKLVSSNVAQSSGVDFLDDEAIEAFKRAQPFANPPKELVESDGQVHFTFAFIFELSGRTSMKVFKYK